MATQAELETALAKIDARLESGVESVTVDGTTTRVNVDSLRKERARILTELAAKQGTSRRPVASRIFLGGF